MFPFFKIFHLTKFISTLLVLLAWAISGQVQAEQQAATSYRLGSGDTITITVFGEQELSKQAMLSDSGKITYPFLGVINVRGLTVVEVEQQIHDGLKGDYLVNPNVSVNIVKYRSIFVAGEVKKPGAYPYQPNLTVSKAAALAGGFSERASMDKIFIIRANDASQTSRSIKVNDTVQPGDIITVKQSFF